MGEEERAPLRIVRGNPTPEELAAVAALMAAGGSAEAPEPRARRGGWNDPSRLHRRELFSGADGWRASGWR